MISAAHAGTSRSLLLARLAEARRRTDALLGMIPAGRLLERPIAERHRFVFYLGHLEAFDWNLLSQRLDGVRTACELDTLFAFGIDPVNGKTPDEPPSAWPDVATIRAYNRDVRHALDASLPHALDAERFGEHFGDATPAVTLIDAAIEHRLMHAETLAYMINQSSIARCVRGTTPVPVPAFSTQLVRIPAGTATLGIEPDLRTFAWDNEHDAHAVDVPAFSISRCMVEQRRLSSLRRCRRLRNRAHWTDADWQWREQNDDHASGVLDRTRRSAGTGAR